MGHVAISIKVGSHSTSCILLDITPTIYQAMPCNKFVHSLPKETCNLHMLDLATVQAASLSCAGTFVHMQLVRCRAGDALKWH